MIDVRPDQDRHQLLTAGICQASASCQQFVRNRLQLSVGSFRDGPDVRIFFAHINCLSSKNAIRASTAAPTSLSSLIVIICPFRVTFGDLVETTLVGEPFKPRYSSFKPRSSAVRMGISTVFAFFLPRRVGRRG